MTRWLRFSTLREHNVYVDLYGKAEKVEDVFSKIKMAREHYDKVGLGADFVS